VDKRWFQNNLTEDKDRLDFIMPRQPRLDMTGALHHVMGRGIDKINLYISPQYLACANQFMRGLMPRLKNVTRKLTGNGATGFTKQAQKDAKKIAQSGLRSNAERLIQMRRSISFPPPYEKYVKKTT
jgi:hypothetical protein